MRQSREDEEQVTRRRTTYWKEVKCGASRRILWKVYLSFQSTNRQGRNRFSVGPLVPSTVARQDGDATEETKG